MKVIVVGGGKVGSYLAKSLIDEGHKVTVLEKRKDICAKLEKEIDSEQIFKGDGCDPLVLDEVNASSADLLVAVTGDDEDNLVVSQQAKQNLKIPRVVARVNNPRNQWLFDRQFGVDVAVSAVHIISKVIQEEASLGDIVTLLKLEKGEISLVELILSPKANSVGKMIKASNVPPEAVLVPIVRDEKISIPHGDTFLQAGDKVLALTSTKEEQALKDCLGI